jgi:predicted enzyme related to lactoylglutathione lyase
MPPCGAGGNGHRGPVAGRTAAQDRLPPLSHSTRLIRYLFDDQAAVKHGRRPREETSMSPAIRSLVVPVADLDTTKAVYTGLFGTPHTDQPYYVGYNVNGFEVSLAPGETTDGPVAYADVDDLDAARATLAAGAIERSAPRQVAPQARVCVLADPNGNPIGLRGR